MCLWNHLQFTVTALTIAVNQTVAIIQSVVPGGGVLQCCYSSLWVWSRQHWMNLTGWEQCTVAWAEDRKPKSILNGLSITFLNEHLFSSMATINIIVPQFFRTISDNTLGVSGSRKIDRFAVFIYEHLFSSMATIIYRSWWLDLLYSCFTSYDPRMKIGDRHFCSTMRLSLGAWQVIV
jgi:hypothetical protein